MREALRARAMRRLPPSLHRPLRIVRIATATGGLPFGARLGLLRSAPRACRPVTRADVSIALPGGAVYLGAESLYVDAMTLGYLWRERVFAADCRGRVVIDLGAHKGYFAVWALAHGAAHVYSMEPHSGNFERLQRARRSHRAAHRWTAERVAVGSAERTVTLFVSSESWAHSVQEGMVDAVSEETVPMITLAEVMARVRSEHPDLEVVLKVNVEGSVGDILLGAHTSDLRRVVEVHLDHEPGSPYDLGAVLAHLAAAGLDDVERVLDKIFVIRRTARAQDESV